MVEHEADDSHRWVPLVGTRVLKTHVDAVLEALPAAKAALAMTKEVRSFATVLAEAVVTAADDKTQYVIVTRTTRMIPVVFGPYVTYAAASKAMSKPFPLRVVEPISIIPLYKHPMKGITFDE